MADLLRARTWIDRIFDRLVRRRFARALVMTATLAASAGCATAASTRVKLDDAVQETNIAARWGRGDIAVERVPVAARDAFVKRHRGWGSELRIVDVELGGVEKMGTNEATVLVAFEWLRQDEGQLRKTVVRQKWKTDDSGWWLVDEERASGDVGLLGDAVAPKAGEAPRAAAKPRYETTTIPGE